MTVGDLTLLSVIERCRSVDQLGLINIEPKNCTMFTKIDHTLGRTISLNTFQKINILQIFIQFKFNMHPCQKESQQTKNSLTKMELN